MYKNMNALCKQTELLHPLPSFNGYLGRIYTLTSYLLSCSLSRISLLRCHLQITVHSVPPGLGLGAKEGHGERKQTGEGFGLSEDGLVRVTRGGDELEVMLTGKDVGYGTDPAEVIGFSLL